MATYDGANPSNANVSYIDTAVNKKEDVTEEHVASMEKSPTAHSLSASSERNVSYTDSEVKKKEEPHNAPWI